MSLKHEQPPLDAGQTGVSILFQVGRSDEKALHTLPDELLLLLQTRLSSFSTEDKTNKADLFVRLVFELLFSLPEYIKVSCTLTDRSCSKS